MGNTTTKQCPVNPIELEKPELEKSEFNCVSTQTEPMSIPFMLNASLSQFHQYSVQLIDLYIAIFKQKYF